MEGSLNLTGAIRLEVIGEDGSPCVGSVQYGLEYQVRTTTSPAITLHLDTSSAAAVTWDMAASTTRLHLQPAA